VNGTAVVEDEKWKAFFQGLEKKNEYKANLDPVYLSNQADEDVQKCVILPKNPDESVMRRIQEEIGNITTAMDTLSSCPVTAQVQITMTTDKKWILHSKGPEGTNKTVGGDEYYIVWQPELDHGIKSVAVVTDLNDGRYELDFYKSFMDMEMNKNPTVPEEDPSGTSYDSDKGGYLIVNLDYTCGIGRMPPPTKDEWEKGGSPRAEWTSSHLVPAPPNMKEMATPKIQPYGTMLDRDYADVYFFGDSTMGQLWGDPKKPWHEGTVSFEYEHR